MKTTLLLFLAITFSIGLATAQKINKSDLPAPVKAKFQSLYPTVKDVNWRKQKNGNYEAEFKLNISDLGVTMDSVGNVKETEMEMKVPELSKAAKAIFDYIANNYPDYKITETSQITYADGKPMYEVEITKGKDKFDLLFDSSFKFNEAPRLKSRGIWLKQF